MSTCGNRRSTKSSSTRRARCHKTPADIPQLQGTSLRHSTAAQRLAEALRRNGSIDIREGYQGLEIASTSFVGRVDVGPVRIAIEPKLPAMPLAILLGYAYRLRDLSLFGRARTPTIRYGLHDLLIEMLADEVQELVSRGLARRYISLSEKLESPRGRILTGVLARQGGITEARLPCQHFDRSINWHLNQVLLAGLGAAAQMTEDRELRRRVQRLSGAFDGIDHARQLEIGEIDRAERALTRLNQANASALTIVRLLKNMRGVMTLPPGIDPG